MGAHSPTRRESMRQWWAERRLRGEMPTREPREARLAKARERSRLKYLKDPDARRAAARLSHHENREARLAARRLVYAANLEQMRERDRARRAAQADTFRQRSSEQYEKHKARKLAGNKRWRDSNRERTREMARRRDALKAQTSIGPVDYAAILQGSGGKCGICRTAVDVADPRAYHFDHIVPLSKGGAHVQSNIQLAHATCNMRKHARVA